MPDISWSLAKVGRSLEMMLGKLLNEASANGFLLQQKAENAGHREARKQGSRMHFT